MGSPRRNSAHHPVRSATHKGARTCGGSYLKARKCSDSTVVEIGMASTDAALYPGSFKRNSTGVCYYFRFVDDPVSTAPATLLTPADVTAYDCCLACNGGVCCNVKPGTVPPRTILAVLSNVIICSGCQLLGTYVKIRSGYIDPNGTYCLEYDSALSSGHDYCA
jgi:hypothetical protein